jgi:hypothetical protein
VYLAAEPDPFPTGQGVFGCRHFRADEAIKQEKQFDVNPGGSVKQRQQS